MYVRVLSFILALGITSISGPSYAQVSPQEKQAGQVCLELLDWLYKDLTLQNLDKSFERLKTKLFMGMLKTLENVQKVNLKNYPELLKLWKSLAQIDPSFEEYLNENSPYKRYRFWRNKSYGKIKTYNFFAAVKAWKDLQETRPEFFLGLEEKNKLDKWDLLSADVIDHIGDINYQDSSLKEKLTELSSALKEISKNPTKKLTSDVNLSELKKKMDHLQKELYENSSKLYLNYLDDYKSVCSAPDIAQIDSLHLEDYICVDSEKTEADLTPLLINLAKVITTKDLNTIKRPELPAKAPPAHTKDEVDKLNIVKIDYAVNPDSDAYYCIRDPNIVDTLIIHHTGDPKRTSPELINRVHIGRSTRGDPWYMVGYNYLVSEARYGGTSKSPAIIQGRSPEVRGAHAGGFTRPLSQERRDELSQYTIKCGRDDKFKETNMSAEFQKDHSISGNITTFGIAIIGNYEARYRATVGGVTILRNASGSGKVIYPSQAVITKVAQLACKLQRQYPNIKRIVPHSYFRATDCPGSVIAKLQEITNIANSYEGCHFNDPEYVK